MKTRVTETKTNQIDEATQLPVVYRETEKWIPMSGRGGPSQDECAATFTVISAMLTDLDGQIAALVGRKNHLLVAQRALMVGSRGD